MNRRRVYRVVAAFFVTLLAVVAACIVELGGVFHRPASVGRWAAIAFFRSVFGIQLVVLSTGPLIVLVAGAILFGARRKNLPAPFAARALLLSVSCLIGCGVIEAGAAAFHGWKHRDPVLRTEFPSSRPARVSTTRRPDLVVLVIGESSALGVPYERWLSVGHVVVWQLQRVFPDRRCRLVMKAKPGATAAQMHAELADLDIRPDVVLIYCGHNEYFSRFPWSRAVPHYLDESPPQSLAERFDRLGRQTFLGLAAMKAIERQQVSEPPPRWVTRSLVDVPAFTYAESQEVVADYARRLRMIVAYCARIGAVPVLLVPAGNDGAFEPNRSVLPPQTSCSERAAFARGFMQARRAEAENPAQSETFFLALLRRAPSFAETHFRLARLRARAGDWPAAREHFAMARDLDGMPQRCTSALQRACRKAGEGPDCILVDGPRVLETLVPDKILDDRLFHDAHHPTLLGYVALAQDVLNQLQSRRALDWPDGMNAPRIDPMECAAQFGLGVRQWAAVCLHGRLWYRDEAYVRYDPRARLEQSRRLGAAMLRLVAGTAPEQSGIPGLGCQPDLSRPQLGPDGLTTD